MCLQKYQKNTILLNNLFEFLGDSEGMSTEEVKQELRKDGTDPDLAIKRLMTTVQKASAESENKYPVCQL